MEWVFDIPEAELENYTLMCDLCHYGCIKGPWCSLGDVC